MIPARRCTLPSAMPPAADGGIDAARYYRCEIVTRTQKAGELIGRLESLVDAKAWPYPTYADILFSV